MFLSEKMPLEPSGRMWQGLAGRWGVQASALLRDCPTTLGLPTTKEPRLVCNPAPIRTPQVLQWAPGHTSLQPPQTMQVAPGPRTLLTRPQSSP